MGKLSASRRALLLANLFNLLVAVYFIIIAIVALVQLRWYHQLTVTVRLRHLVTSATSYFAFFLLIFVALVLMGTFVASTLQVQRQQQQADLLVVHEQIHHPEDGEEEEAGDEEGEVAAEADGEGIQKGEREGQQVPQEQRQRRRYRIVGRQGLTTPRQRSSLTSACCSTMVYLLATVGLVVILVVWLFNTGELVRESISTQLDMAFVKYQFSNRSNHYSIAIDGMQDTNNCCGSLDYTDFPHQRITGLSSGLYPGSCCGKNIFGVNARVLCTPEEVWRAKQTSGCTTVLANYYDLISLLVVPVALICLFVNITIIALVTIARPSSSALNRQVEPYTGLPNYSTPSKQQPTRLVSKSLVPLDRVAGQQQQVENCQ